MVTSRITASVISLAVLLAACAGPAAPAGSANPSIAVGGASPGCACLATLPPVSDPVCQAATGPIDALTPLEGFLRTGSLGDGSAETEVLGIQQALVNDEQAAGLASPLGSRLQAVVSALGELGVLLNQNRPPADLVPALTAVDQAVGALSAACSAAG